MAPLLALRFHVFFETILPGKRESLSWQETIYRKEAKADFVGDAIAILATILSHRAVSTGSASCW